MDVLVFGIVREMAGRSIISIELPESSTAIDLKRELAFQFPQIKALASCMIAVNGEYAEDHLILSPEDEIAVIPPVSGG